MKNNFHKVRGKREFLFDDKELFMLGGGAVTICILLFILGVMVGQSLEQQSVASPLGAEASYSEENFGLEESLPSDNAEMRAVDEQQESAAAPPPQTSQTSPKTGSSYFTVLSTDKDVYVEVEATPVKTSEPKPEPTEPPAAEQPEVVQEPQHAAQPIQEAIPQPPQETAAAQVQTVAAAPAALPNVPRDPSDEIRFGRQGQARQTADSVQQQPLPEGTIYSVQVASSPNREDSERLVKRFGQFGYQAYVMEADLAEKGVWYRVRVGNRSTRAQAEALQDELVTKASELVNSPYVIKVAE